MDYDIDQPDRSEAATPPGDPVSETPAPAPRRGGPLMLLAAGAAIGGALVTMAILGRTAPGRATSAVPPGRLPAEMTTDARRSTPPTLLPRWSQAHEDRWISNHPRSVAWEIDAVAPVAIWMRHVRPMLVVRCLAKTTDVFVFTDSAARIEPRDDRHSVRLGFDDEADVVERWPDSADHDALFAPDGVLIAQRLAAARSMRFTFTPHNADRVTAQFDVVGFDAIASGMAKTCGWK